MQENASVDSGPAATDRNSRKVSPFRKPGKDPVLTLGCSSRARRRVTANSSEQLTATERRQRKPGPTRIPGSSRAADLT